MHTHTYRFVDVYNEERINDIHFPRTPKKKSRMFFENEMDSFTWKHECASIR